MTFYGFTISIFTNSTFNPNTLWGKVQKKGGRKGGWWEKMHAASSHGPGLEPGTYRMLGESPQLHATVIVKTKPFYGYR